MDFFSYITENALILIPVIYIIGMILKGIEKLNDKYIPIILLPVGILLSMGVMHSFSVDAIIQGVLVTGVSVYANQLVKQSQKKE
ncbi:phage holin family protein [uncultured Clostridium sp.]|uniref:phage holin family protein n=1 Tax=uncultured Clostridium sp. TaxID=59620 RepID=UPI00321625C6